MNFQIEIAQEKDVPQIVAMLRDFAEFEKLSEFCEITEESLLDAMFGENACVEGLVAFDAEKPIGYALFYENFSSFRGQRGFYLEDLYVETEYRGQRIGEAFLRRIAQIGKSRNFKRIDFQVLEWNEPAVKFYEKLGAVKDLQERHFKFTDAAFEKLGE